MTPEDQQQLKRILVTFDEAGLVALANKGLVRRAQKDYETTAMTCEETDTAIRVRGPDWNVTMPATGPVDATDDTPATGVTRQILTATIFLRATWAVSDSVAASEVVSSTGDSATAEIEISPIVTDTSAATSEIRLEVVNPQLQSAIAALHRLTIDDLTKWAGKVIVADSLNMMNAAPQVEIERTFGLTIRFPQHETEVRLIPKSWGRSIAALLDQFLTNAPKVFRRQWAVMAVIALRAQAGLPNLCFVDASTSESAEDRQSRSQVLQTADDVLDGMTRTGLAHPSERMVQRLFTLSVSATGAHLPRLSRTLRAIADDLELILHRDAKGNSERLFDQISVAHALTLALKSAGERPPIDLVGRHRTEYESIGDLQLAGAGAFPWRTASGFEGVTGLFWDRQSERFWTWTESRPENGPGRFDLQAVYQTTAPWADGPALSQLCRSAFTLKNARANPQGRLSASQQSTVEMSKLENWPRSSFGSRDFSSWKTLADYSQRLHPMGLRLPDPLQRIVVIRPREWGPRVFDETQQRLVWTVFDSHSLPLQLIVRWEEVNEATISFLESVKADRDRLTAVIGRVEQGTRELIVEPLALFSDGTSRGDRLLNPAFDQRLIEVKQASLLERLRSKFGRGHAASAIAVDQDETLALDHASFPSTIEYRLAELESRLLRLAETGMRPLDDLHRQQVTDLGRRLERYGLGPLSDGVSNLVKAQTPASLMWCRYLCRLHREAALSATFASQTDEFEIADEKSTEGR